MITWSSLCNLKHSCPRAFFGFSQIGLPASSDVTLCVSTELTALSGTIVFFQHKFGTRQNDLIISDRIIGHKVQLALDRWIEQLQRDRNRPAICSYEMN